jgi:hypothetical protein
MMNPLIWFGLMVGQLQNYGGSAEEKKRKPRPYVTAALLCERVIQEKDESLSIVRIIDNIQYQLQGIGMISTEKFVSTTL